MDDDENPVAYILGMMIGSIIEGFLMAFGAYLFLTLTGVL